MRNASRNNNTFFSIQVGEEKLKDFDHSFYDVIVFDEIYFNSIPILARIKTFVEKNPDKIIVGNRRRTPITRRCGYN